LIFHKCLIISSKKICSGLTSNYNHNLLGNMVLDGLLTYVFYGETDLSIKNNSFLGYIVIID